MLTLRLYVNIDTCYRMPLKETNWDDDLFGPYISKIYSKTTFIPKMNITRYTKGHYLRMKKYINHITSYEPYLPELKKYVFNFKSSLLLAAKERLDTYGFKKNDTTFVSIHVRLTDYHTVLDDLPGISKNYFTRSMTYFSEKYEVY